MPNITSSSIHPTFLYSHLLLPPSPGELQSILSAVFSSADIAFTGTLSGDVYKWKGHNLLSVVRGAHSGAIYSIHGNPDGFATGSRDGTVRLWNTEFQPVTQLDLGKSRSGYKGECFRVCNHHLYVSRCMHCCVY